VLGAGNCNDLSLDALGAHFTRVELIDLDAEALAFGLSRVTAHRERFVTHVADVVGGLEVLPTWKHAPPSPAALRAWHDDALAALERELSTPADVVLVSGVLSQLMWSLAQTLGESHPALGAVAQLVVLRHLKTCLRLARQQLVLVVDVAPLPGPLGDDEAVATLGALVERNGCYPGTSPRTVLPALRQLEPNLQLTSGPVWTWPVKPDRHHLVFSVLAHRP
jgi:hypothetical protein